MEEKRIIYGIQTFESLNESNCIYVDKTDLIYKLVKENKFAFFSRPRRFGRSLLLSTLKSYFEGKKEQFEGLKIYSLEKEWKKYPVLRFSFIAHLYDSIDSLELKLSRILSEYEEKYLDTVRDADVYDRFNQLIEDIYYKTGEKVVILVDEYDKPFLSRPEFKKEYKHILKCFFENLQCCSEYIHFALITGVTNEQSLCFDLNLADITLIREYSTLCGFTQEELIANFSSYIKKLAEEYNLTFDECMLRLKDRYGGYYFHEDSPELYSPSSILECLSSSDFKSYWFEIGTPTFLVEKLLKNEEFDLSRFLKPVEIDSYYFLSDLIESTLFQTGYLTIQSYDTNSLTYTLKVPNKEVERAYSSLSGYLKVRKKGEYYLYH